MMYDDSVVHTTPVATPSTANFYPTEDIDLLKKLCSIHAPAGNESPMTEFILSYIEQEKHTWKVQPKIVAGEDFQDCIILVFGKPRTAIFAHMDSIGYMVRYEKELVKIGGPRFKDGYLLKGTDTKGDFTCTLRVIDDGKDDKDKKIVYEADREIDRGTDLSFVCNFRETDDYVQACYMDNRLGCWAALKVAENLENGIIVFSCYEEVGGGTVPFLAKYIYENYKVKQALICDITWVTSGVLAGHGVAISMRDSLLPRRSFVQKVIRLAEQSNIPFQLEVESAGGSDGKELQSSPYPFDWCFIGAPEENVHTPDEKVDKRDISAMLNLYCYLMEQL